MMVTCFGMLTLNFEYCWSTCAASAETQVNPTASLPLASLPNTDLSANSWTESVFSGQLGWYWRRWRYRCRDSVRDGSVIRLGGSREDDDVAVLAAGGVSVAVSDADAEVADAEAEAVTTAVFTGGGASDVTLGEGEGAEA